MNRRDVLTALGATGLASLSEFNCLAKSAPASDIFLNQLGYLPASFKKASIRIAQSQPPKSVSFVIRATGTHSIVLRGEAGTPALDEASGDTILVADFSKLQTPGQFRIETTGSVSDQFPIGQDVYADALKLTMRSFYGQRCGCAVDLGKGYKHPACHADGAFHPTSGRTGKLSNHGGWHDAGDYGRYVVNSGLSTGTLLWAWEIYPEVLKGLVLDIPESGGKLPDYLAEIRWNLEWMLSMQDSDGGVWHKQTSEKFCAFILPQDDTLTSYVIGTGETPFKSTGATADLAAVMAIAARIYEQYDASFALQCLLAARKAFAWATNNPNIQFTNPTGIATGGYGDRQLADELLWASAELWRTTGDSAYEKAFLAGVPEGDLTESAPVWGNVQSMAWWTYVLADRQGSKTVRTRIIDATISEAQQLAARTKISGYGNTLALRDYNWGSNGVAGNQSMLLLVADKLQADPALREAALSNLHYLLGRNCFGISWVTQLGIRPFQHPHHRPSAADGISAPWPGLLSGGPNAHGGDAVADKLPKQPPMKMWVDDQAAYSLNEIAINWNAPLVFLLAAANA